MSDSPTQRIGLFRAVMTVSLFSIATPLSFWAVNAPRGASGMSLALIGSVILATGLLVFFVLARFLERGRAAALSAVLVLAFLNWRLLGDPIRAIPGMGVVPIDVAPIPTLAVLLFLAWLYGHRREFQIPALVMGSVMALSPLPALIGWYSGGEIPPASSDVYVEPWSGADGDVYFVVLDGYGRSDVLEDLYGLSIRDAIGMLEAHGFVVPSGSHTNYSSTVASIAGALLLRHVGNEGERPTDRDRVSLHKVIGGESPTVEAFLASGYRYVHVESGWDGARCGTSVDSCFGATFPSEVEGVLLDRTAIAWWLERRVGHAFSVNGLRALDDLIAIEQATDTVPRFVFAHVVLPHPPLFIDRDCSIRFERRLGGGAVGSTELDEGVLLAERKKAYGEQAVCVNSKLLDFVESLDPDDYVIVTGDHGPDSFAQLSLNPAEWTADAVWERMSVFSAIRLPGCEDDVPDDWMVVDGLRLVFDCLSGSTPPPEEDRMFVFPVDASPGVMTELTQER